jgi:RimJ/RimL family protein N-acetyltransferase
MTEKPRLRLNWDGNRAKANDDLSRYRVFSVTHRSIFCGPKSKMIALREYADSDLERLVNLANIEYQGLFVGSVGITPQRGWREHLGEIGYWVSEDHWGKGIATAALRQMTEYGFKTRNFRKLIAPVLDPNIASMRVLEKCGYELEGILKGEVKKGGTYFDQPGAAITN